MYAPPLAELNSVTWMSPDLLYITFFGFINPCGLRVCLMLMSSIFLRHIPARRIQRTMHYRLLGLLAMSHGSLRSCLANCIARLLA